MTLQEWQSIPENMQRVKDRIAVRKNARENYKPTLWDVAVEKFKITNFPEQSFMDKIKALDPNQGESHVYGKDSHTLQTFKISDKFGGFTVVWKYNFCPQCSKIITKKGVILNDYTNSAFVKYFVRNSEEKTQPKKESPRKTHSFMSTEEIVEKFSSPFGEKEDKDGTQRSL